MHRKRAKYCIVAFSIRETNPASEILSWLPETFSRKYPVSVQAANKFVDEFSICYLKRIRNYFDSGASD
jgi:hypothetical protein